MNLAIIIGNLTKDPELKYSTGQNQTAVCKFSVAVTDGYGDKEQTSYIPVVVFGKQGENCERFLAKGSKTCVRGRIQTGSYTNKEGRKVYTTDLIADKVEFLSHKDNGERQQPAQQHVQEQMPEPVQEMMPVGFEAVTEEDIPF